MSSVEIIEDLDALRKVSKDEEHWHEFHYCFSHFAYQKVFHIKNKIIHKGRYC